MSTIAEQLRLEAIRPALHVLEPVIVYSRVAENQILGDWAHESGGFIYRVQWGGGPARGLGQVEEPSFRDVYVRYLGTRPVLRGKLDALWPNDGTDPWLQMEHNDKFAAGFHRIKYAMSPRPLAADPNDVFEMARAWKQIWNTPLGKGTPEQWIADYRRNIGGLYRIVTQPESGQNVRVRGIGRPSDKRGTPTALPPPLTSEPDRSGYGGQQRGAATAARESLLWLHQPDGRAETCAASA